MSWKTIILLGVTALFMSVSVLLDEPQGAGDGEQGGRLFSGLEGGAVAQVQLSRVADSSEVQLKRDDNGWRMLLPVKDRADRSRVEALLAGVEFMRPLRWLPGTAPPAGSGLEEPGIRLILTSGGGAYKLEVGASDASGQGTYVRTEQGGKARLAVAPRRLLQLLDHSSETLRDHQLVPLTPAQILRVELRGESGDVTLKSQPVADVPWITEVQGRPCRANAQRLRRMLNALSALRARSLHLPPESGSRPWIRLNTTGGMTLSLKQAGPCPGRGDQVLLRVEEQRGGASVRILGACVDQQEAALLSPAPHALQDLSLTRLTAPELGGLNLEAGGQKVALVRTPSGWTRQGEPVDGLLVPTLVDLLRETQGRLVQGARATEPRARVRLMAEAGGTEDLSLFSEPGGLLRVHRAGDNVDLMLEPEASRAIWDGVVLMGR